MPIIIGRPRPHFALGQRQIEKWVCPKTWEDLKMTLFTVFFLNISIRFGEAHLGEAATASIVRHRSGCW